MRSWIAALRTLVLPYGRTTGKRIVLDGVNGLIAVYDAVKKILQIDSDGLHVTGSVSEIDLTVDSGNDSLITFTDPTKPTPLSWLGRALIRATPGGLGGLALDLWSGFDVTTPTSEHSRVLISDHQLFMYHSDTSGGLAGGAQMLFSKTDIQVQMPLRCMGEVWNAVTFANGWSNLGANWDTAQYRKYPDNTVMLRGVVTGGTKTDATVMTTLPVGYRPAKDMIFPVGNGSGGTVANPNIRIFSNGQVQIFGMAAATTAAHSWSVTFPLDA